MTLSDWTEARVRPISPDDGPALREFHRSPSDRSRFSRYFCSHPGLSSEDVQQLTSVDGVDRVALVVEVNGELIAVGRYH